MIYIINHQITFCNEDRTLSLLNDIENSLVLSSPAARLLLTLIINKNTPLTREYLLTTVWEDYGFTASGSNLNNYISELRKCLKHLEPNFSGIITIPRVGFQFVAHVETLLSKQPQQENTATLHISSPILVNSTDHIDTKDKIDDNSNSFSQSEGKPRNAQKSPIRKNVLIFAMISLPLIIVMIYLFLINNNRMALESVRFIFKKDNCNIYALDEFTILSNEEIMQKIDDNLNRELINCKTNNIYDIYYSYLPKSDSRLNSTEFLGICLQNNDQNDMHKNCYSLYNKAE